MKKKVINWGIIGLGNIAHQFAKDLQLVADAKLVAVASRTQQKASEFAKQYHIRKAYGDYNAILQDPNIDIIYIATPHDSHENIAIRSLKAGKHVLCEKPLAVNQEQVKRMTQAAREKRLFLMEAFWSKFNPSIVQCLELVKSGVIGEVNYVNADFSFYRNDPDESRMLNMELAGGSLLDMGVYPVFLAYSIFGIPQKILAAGRFHKTGADIQTSAILTFENGLANIMSGFASQTDMVAKIYGTKGRIYIHPFWHETQGFTLIEGNHDTCKTSEISNPTIGKGFTYEIEECVNCLNKGLLESPNWTHQNSLDLITITDEIRNQIGLTYPFEKK